jgi:hypothetical protein
MDVVTAQRHARTRSIATATGLGASNPANTMPARPPPIFDNRWRAISDTELNALSRNSAWLHGVNTAREAPFFPGSTIRFWRVGDFWYLAVFRQQDARTFYFVHGNATTGRTTPTASSGGVRHVAGTPETGTGASLLDRWSPVPTSPPPTGAAPPTSPPPNDPHWIALATAPANVGLLARGAQLGSVMRGPRGSWTTWRQGQVWYGEKSVGTGPSAVHRYYRFDPGAARGPLAGAPEGVGAPRAVTDPSLHRYGGTNPVTPDLNDPHWTPMQPAMLARLQAEPGWTPAVVTAQQHARPMFHYHGAWYKMGGGRFWILGAGSSPRAQNPPAFAGAPGVGDTATTTLPTTTITGASQATLNAANALIGYFNSTGIPYEGDPIQQVTDFQNAYNSDSTLGGSANPPVTFSTGNGQLAVDGKYGPDTQSALSQVYANPPAPNTSPGAAQPPPAPLPSVPGAQPDYTIPILIGAGVIGTAILAWALWPKEHGERISVSVGPRFRRFVRRVRRA